MHPPTLPRAPSPTAVAGELERLEETLETAIVRAGSGEDPAFDRRLNAHARNLRMLLAPDAFAAAEKVLEDARRVMAAAEPAAPLLMLGLSRDQLAAAVRRMQRLRRAA